MTRVWTALLFLALARSAAGQGAGTYIQVEAQPTQAEAVAAAEDYAMTAGNVSGFRLGGSWYAVVLGPYPRRAAEDELARLRFLGRIPRDAYLTTRADYGARFWPNADPAPQAAVVEAPGAGDRSPRETQAEALRGERLLSRGERAEVQTALVDAGVYSGAIDAAFGPATRRAMAAWQDARGFEATGILTTDQRAALIAGYREVFEGLGMDRIRDREAGIELVAPAGVVARSGTDSPFVRYEPTGDLPARLLLISQEGDAAGLSALYDILQTLEIVPLDGPRQLRPASFEIEGRGDDIVSYTFARLTEGEIKGFTLVWPADDERRRLRVVDEMRASFRAVPGVLPEPEAPAAGRDLLAGLDVRRPERDRTGFYVDGGGSVLTTAEAVRACGRVTFDSAVDADVTAEDAALGVALLRPRSRLTPVRYARFRTEPPRLQSEIAVAGYPYGGVLPAASLNFGRLTDRRGPDGDAGTRRLDLASEPGEAGGPVLDAGGAVVGMLRAPEGDRRLPDGVALATGAEPIAGFLAAAGLAVEPSTASGEVPPAHLTRLAADMTVLVSCWN
jgi:S1-C subfamily serine protease